MRPPGRATGDWWDGGAPVVTQDSQQSGRKHDVAVLAALALVDANDLTPAVDVGWS